METTTSGSVQTTTAPIDATTTRENVVTTTMGETTPSADFEVSVLLLAEDKAYHFPLGCHCQKGPCCQAKALVT